MAPTTLKRNADGFKSAGLKAGELRQGFDGRSWRIVGPADLAGDDTLVVVVDLATGATEHRYARTVALWPSTTLEGAQVPPPPPKPRPERKPRHRPPVKASPPRKCVGCGEMFVSPQSRRIWCSERCRSRARRARAAR
jgi:hypothetical protein